MNVLAAIPANGAEGFTFSSYSEFQHQWQYANDTVRYKIVFVEGSWEFKTLFDLVFRNNIATKEIIVRDLFAAYEAPALQIQHVLIAFLLETYPSMDVEMAISRLGQYEVIPLSMFDYARQYVSSRVFSDPLLTCYQEYFDYEKFEAAMRAEGIVVEYSYCGKRYVIRKLMGR